MQAGLLRMGFSRTKACLMLSERVPGKKDTGRPSEGGRNMRTQRKDGKTHGACGDSALSGSIFCFGARAHEARRGTACARGTGGEECPKVSALTFASSRPERAPLKEREGAAFCGAFPLDAPQAPGRESRRTAFAVTSFRSAEKGGGEMRNRKGACSGKAMAARGQRDEGNGMRTTTTGENLGQCPSGKEEGRPGMSNSAEQ